MLGQDPFADHEADEPRADRLGEGDLLPLALVLARALRSLHKHGLCHRAVPLQPVVAAVKDVPVLCAADDVDDQLARGPGAVVHVSRDSAPAVAADDLLDHVDDCLCGLARVDLKQRESVGRVEEKNKKRREEKRRGA